MYTDFYRLHAKPFQLTADPDFFFASRGHSRAMAYLEYGLAQEDGFIVITGEVGAGKSTLVRNLCRRLPSESVVPGEIVTTALDGLDMLRMVVASFRQPFENISKAALLMRLEMFMQSCSAQGKRLLLIVDEAQNLSPQALEELRMLSNLQCGGQPVLQTFLLGQPEFRHTMMSPQMRQLRQRVLATYHLGPLSVEETRGYIEHRLQRAGWQHDPALSDDAFERIHRHTLGIPRSINTLCDRLLLLGCLEQMHSFDAGDVQRVIDDISEEFAAPAALPDMPAAALPPGFADSSPGYSEDARVLRIDPGAGQRRARPEERADNEPLEAIEQRISRMETSVGSLLDVLRRFTEPAWPRSGTNKDRP